MREKLRKFDYVYSTFKQNICLREKCPVCGKKNFKLYKVQDFKELDKKSNGYISRSIKDSISPSNQNHLISSLGGVKAKKILLAGFDGYGADEDAFVFSVSASL